MGQASGSSAKIYTKMEKINGTIRYTTVSGGLDGTLAKRVLEGVTDLSVNILNDTKQGVSIGKGDNLKLDSGVGAEFVQVSHVVGTPLSTPVKTTLNGAVAKGATSLIVTSATGLSAGDYVQVGSGTVSEIIKLGTKSTATFTIPATKSAYADNAPVEKVVSPYTIHLTSRTKTTFLHKSGVAIIGATAENWTYPLSIRDYDPADETGVFQSQGLSGYRGISATKKGNNTVNGNLTAEMDLSLFPFYLWQTLSDKYSTTGVPLSTPKKVDLDALATAGSTSFTVDDATEFSVGDFMQIGTGSNAEVVKIKSVTGTAVTGSAGQIDSTTQDAVGASTVHLATAVSTFGSNDFLQIRDGDDVEFVKIDSITNTKVPTIHGKLRKATVSGNAVKEVAAPFTVTVEGTEGTRVEHAKGIDVERVLAPFTHIITKGNQLPPGFSMLLGFTDIKSYVLVGGTRIDSFEFSINPDDLPMANLSLQARTAQTLGIDIFGTPTELPMYPYGHWEATVTVGTTELTTNHLRQLSISFPNNLSADAIVGSQHPGQITSGAAETTGQFTTQYETQAFVDRVKGGKDNTGLKIKFDYTGDDNHTIELNFHKVLWHGSGHPGASDKSGVEGVYSFMAILDTAQPKTTDVTVTVKNNQRNLSELTEKEV